PDRRWCGRRPIPRLTAACEHLDDDHATAAARARAGQHARLVRAGCFLLLGLDDARSSAEQLASTCDALGAIGVGEEPIVADTVEALRQDVDQEAADELVRRQRHRLPALGAFDAVVLPAERDAA